MRPRKFDDERLMLRVSDMFYNQNIKQQEIADTLGLSRPTVAKLLKEAKKNGYVKISVIDPNGRRYYQIEHQLEDLFGLKEVYITETGESGDSYDSVGQGAAQLLNRIIKPDSIIGLSLGHTLAHIPQYLDEQFYPGTRFIPLVGGMGIIPQEIHGNTLIENFSNVYSGTHYPIYVPAMLNNPHLKEEFTNETSVRTVFDLASKMDIAMVGLGSSSNSTLIQTGYISPDDQKELIKNGMVGDLCMQYYDIDGNTDKFSLNKKVFAVDLESIKQADWAIGICFGEEKVPSIIGAINGGYINTLVTDFKTAMELLSSVEKKEEED